MAPASPAPGFSASEEESEPAARWVNPWIKIGGVAAGMVAFCVAYAVMFTLTSGGFGTKRQARIAYRQACQKLKSKDFPGAIEYCKKALEHDPKMAEASSIGGMATLGVGDAKPSPAVFTTLLAKAASGDTTTLDTCDAWMRDCIKRCDQAPDRRPVDRDIRSTKHLKSEAQIILALTAFLRVGASAQANNIAMANAWLGVMDKHLRAAEATEPGNKSLSLPREAYGKAQGQLALRQRDLQRAAAAAAARPPTTGRSPAAGLGRFYMEQREKQEGLREMMRRR